MRIVVFVALFISSCSGTNFSGSSKDTAKAPATADAQPFIPPPITEPPTTMNNPTMISAGSFSAWAVPPSPMLEQAYDIYIEVTLPSNISGYTLQDITGTLSGTDSYKQSFGKTSTRSHPFLPTMVPSDPPRFSVQGNKALIVISVPGASVPLTRDTISIRSDILVEQQELAIQFR